MPRFAKALVAAAFLFAFSPGLLGAQPTSPPAGSEVSPGIRHLAEQLLVGWHLERHLQTWRKAFREADADMNGEVNEADVALHGEAGRAVARMQVVTTTLSADFDGDGAVTEDELRRYLSYSLRFNEQSDGRQNAEFIEGRIDKLKAMDADGDGRVTVVEMLKSAASDPEHASRVTSTARQARSLLTLAPDGRTSVTLADVEAAVETLFRTVDADGDGILSRDEVNGYRINPNTPDSQARLAAVQAAQQRERAWRDAQSKRQREEAEAKAACAMPKASDAAKVVLVGVSNAVVLSSTTIGNQDVAVHVGNVTVEAGDEPLYLVLTSSNPTIWRFAGAVERIERVVLTGATTGPNRSQPREKPLVGAMGLAAELITFLGQPGCFGSFSETPTSRASMAMAAVSRAIGKRVSVLAAQSSFNDVAVPSGTFRPVQIENRDSRLLAKLFRMLRTDVDWGTDGLKHELRRLNPAGVIEVDPQHVISSLPAERYEVLPQGLGLIQLVHSGAIVRSGHDEYLITRKIRFPAALYGGHSVRFLLLRDVPLPDGDPGHSRVISEETGERVKFGGGG
jgi:Ca2+-binding EF-hand superfamily protein